MMIKVGASVLVTWLLMVGAAFADTYVTTKVVNPAGSGKAVLQKVVHTRHYQPVVVRRVIKPIVVRPFTVVKQRRVVVVQVD